MTRSPKIAPLVGSADTPPARGGRIAAEAARRRTFAIISHPDAGKTTLTENLLLAGGAIRAAGQVRARGENRRTRSDWMKIERERGISVSASVMTFEYRPRQQAAGSRQQEEGAARGAQDAAEDALLPVACSLLPPLVFNLLDTPGHEDFSEDTYRTLTAADAAVMVLDAAKGIEPQTLKLFEVCRLRDIPIVTFINKMDREALDPIELLDEIASKLALDPAPLFWPAGSGGRFRGMLELGGAGRFLPFSKSGEHPEPIAPPSVGLTADCLPPQAGGRAGGEPWADGELEELTDGAELARAGYATFRRDSFLEGHLTPVLFGSALRKFGVRELLDLLGTQAPAPREVAVERDGGGRSAPSSRRDPSVGSADTSPRGRGEADTLVEPGDAEVTGFVFKVQANMDPAHRDRIAMTKLCSGAFRRGMKLKVQNTGRQLSVNAPILFFASDRELAEEAYGGDVIGIPNHGVLRVGDSLSESGTVRFAGLPNFAPEILQRVRIKDPLKAKHLRRALDGLAEEGVTQLFRPELGADFIVGAVGPLQFEVMADRLGSEYGLEVVFEPSPFAEARWLGGDKAALEDFAGKHRGGMARDIDEAPVFLAKSAWETGYVAERYPEVRFERTKERG